MLKIYLRTIKYELHDGETVIVLETDSDYAIKDEEYAVSRTMECGAYTEATKDAYCYSCDLHQTKKGIRAFYWTWGGGVYAKEWVAPNAKLVMHISYKEKSCSMKRLMELPASDVVAYLKQEGLNLSMPS